LLKAVCFKSELANQKPLAIHSLNHQFNALTGLIGVWKATSIEIFFLDKK